MKKPLVHFIKFKCIFDSLMRYNFPACLHFVRFVIQKMNYSLSIVLLFGILCPSSTLSHANEEKKENLPLALSPIEENETESTVPVVGVSVIDEGLSPKALSELHDLAKNISHSKGIYRESDKEVESDGDRDLRRSILKKAHVATESETLRVILNTLDTEENKLQDLEMIEFLVHQYDVAVSFAILGGIKKITPLLFSSDDDIASSVASVLGAAMQSNPDVQKIAKDEEVGKNLMKLLTHKNPRVLSRIIFAMSSYLRNAPEAQVEFIGVNGISKLVDILKNHHISTNIKLKIINLFSDLAFETETAEISQSGRSPEEKAVLKRSFSSEMQKSEVCILVPTFLDLEDFDTHQKVSAAMIALLSACHNDFKSEAIRNRLRKLLKIYDPDPDYEDSVHSTIDRDLRSVLYDELKHLINRVSDESSSKSSQYLLKVEL